MKNNTDYYLNLPYTLELSYDADHAWFIRVKELPGCTSQGETPDEAVAMVKDAMQLWIEDALENGEAIPEPRQDEDFSGRFNLRVPVSLHRKLSEAADEEGVSLNTLCVTALAEAMGGTYKPQAAQPVKAPVEASLRPISAWPGLSVGARRAMLAAGLEDEAGRVDEELFARWVIDQLGAFHSAFEQEFRRDAFADLENLAAMVRIGKQASPALGALEKSIELLETIAKQTSRQRADPNQQMREVLQQAFEPIKTLMVSEGRKTYSAVATRTESSLAEQLFLKE